MSSSTSFRSQTEIRTQSKPLEESKEPAQNQTNGQTKAISRIGSESLSSPNPASRERPFSSSVLPHSQLTLTSFPSEDSWDAIHHFAQKTPFLASCLESAQLERQSENGLERFSKAVREQLKDFPEIGPIEKSDASSNFSYYQRVNTVVENFLLHKYSDLLFSPFSLSILNQAASSQKREWESLFSFLEKDSLFSPYVTGLQLTLRSKEGLKTFLDAIKTHFKDFPGLKEIEHQHGPSDIRYYETLKRKLEEDADQKSWQALSIALAKKGWHLELGAIGREDHQKKEELNEFITLLNQQSSDSFSLEKIKKIIENRSFRELAEQVQIVNLNGRNLFAIPPTLQYFGQITSIDLRNNRIAAVSKNSFTPFKQLGEINLSHNAIHWIDPDSFANLPLSDLDLSHNQLSTLPETLFKKLSQSQLDDGYFSDLNLSGNRLQTISPSMFQPKEKSSPVHSLERLDLSDNQLTQIDPSLLSPLSDLEQFDISNNPIPKSFIKSLKRPNEETEIISDFDLSGT